jgi:cystathionine beta-synthase
LGTGTPGTGTPGTLGAALGALAGRPALVSVTARDPMATALATMRSRGLTALPVTAAAAPVRLAEIAGTITESAILAALVAGVPLDSPIGPLLAPPLPFAGAGQPVAEALPLLSEEPTLLVLDGGLVRGVLSRADLITFLAATTGHGDPQ